ncbi:MAG TPA: 50S ribosomal protein L11 methyltransferase, partial [Sphingomonas sp.]|nr:50S ribosomal protein L11 methyltransferase [Sphingomonas sp.]
MSADAIDSWKTTLPCTRAEAEAIDAADDLAIEAVLMTTEEVEDDRERWRLDAYSEHRPDDAMIAQLRALVPSAAAVEAVIEPLSAQDWVAMSQEGLEPIVEGRFVVHTAAHDVSAPAGGRAFRIDAGQAFGTGHHATTSGCLAMLDRLHDRSYATIIDIGTGTGLLAFAAAHLWPDAHVVATDIDPAAIDVTRENAVLNGIAGLDLLVADGALSDAITA